MTIAWRVELVDTDTYGFFNFSGHPADRVTIEDPDHNQPIAIAGPGGTLLEHLN
jgi:hypothetical protein